MRRICHQAGFTYLAVLFAVAVIGIGLAATGVVWHVAQKREKEAELLFVGRQYRTAIARYYANTPGPNKQYPRELSDLLLDPRQQQVQRYIRKLYPDPITGSRDWGIVRAPDGGIAGIYSRSEEAPIKTANFRREDAAFTGKKRYSEWKFSYEAIVGGADAPTGVRSETERSSRSGLILKKP